MANRDLRASLEQRNAEHEPAFYLLLTEAQARDVMQGRVPDLVQSMARTMVEWMALAFEWGQLQ